MNRIGGRLCFRRFRAWGSLLALALSVTMAMAAIEAVDIDGHTLTLDAPGHVTAVISSSPETQNRTRDAGGLLDRYRGRTDFRIVIVVDLRSSFAGVFPGIVRSQMRESLEAEAARLKPFYLAHGNPRNPREETEAIADFDGALCEKLAWADTPDRLRVVVFGRNGKELGRWSDLTDYAPLQKTVSAALEK